MGRGEVPFLAASREQNSHPNSGVLPSVKSQGWGNFLAIRRLVKIHLGVQTSSNYLGGLADNRHSSAVSPLLHFDYDLKINIESQCSTSTSGLLIDIAPENSSAFYFDFYKGRGIFDCGLFSYFLWDSCNVLEWNFSLETQVSLYGKIHSNISECKRCPSRKSLRAGTSCY